MVKIAVAYWSLKKFTDNIYKALFYVIRYKNTLYYIDGYAMLNLSTLEFFESGFTIKNIGDFKIESEIVKNVCEDIEIVYQKLAVKYGYDEQLKAARIYKERMEGIRKDNPYIVTNSLVDEKGYERREGCIIQYISYDDFMEMAYAEYSGKEFKIKYNDKIYLFKYGMFSCKFGEISPNKSLSKYQNYNDIFTKSRIDENSLYVIWDKCELIDHKLKVPQGGKAGAVFPLVGHKELDEILKIAQYN